MDQTYFGEIPRDVNTMILYRTNPEKLLAACLGDPYLSNICHSREFIENYANYWKDYIIEKYQYRQFDALELGSIIGSWSLISRLLNTSYTIYYSMDPIEKDLSVILLGLLKAKHWDILDFLFAGNSSLSEVRDKIAELVNISGAYLIFNPNSPQFKELLLTAIRSDQPIIVTSLLDIILPSFERSSISLSRNDTIGLLRSALTVSILRKNLPMISLILQSPAMNRLTFHEKENLLKTLSEIAIANKRNGVPQEVVDLLYQDLENAIQLRKTKQRNYFYAQVLSK